MSKTTFALTAAALLAAACGSAVVAQEMIAPPVTADPAGPALEAPNLEAPSVTEFMTPTAHVVAAPMVECCPIAVVSEVAAPSAKRSYRCNGGPIQQVICVDNPSDGCRKNYSVNVCVPACCVDTPVCCDSRVGMLGRGYVTYRWTCGFEATIAFRVHGGVIVTYR